MSGKIKSVRVQYPIRGDHEIKTLANIELEAAVIGTILMFPDALLAAMELLTEDVFYLEKHRLIFRCIRLDFDEKGKSDSLTCNQRLRSNFPESGITPVDIFDLTNRVGSSANFDFHSRVIMELSIKRRLAEMFYRLGTEIFQDLTIDVFEFQDKAVSLIESASGDMIKSRERAMKELIGELILDKIEQQKIGIQGITGVTTGFDRLDVLTGGWHGGKLNIIAARPSVGKTAFALSLVRNAAVSGNPVAVFSLEMGANELTERLLASEANVFGTKIKSADLNDRDWTSINQTLHKIESMPIWVDDTPELKLFELKAKARRMKHLYGIKLIVIDYLQLMTADESDRKQMREQQISNISRGLKIMAKELDIPVIALSQLSRAVESRGGEKRPQLSDLRESGSIEQDADVVMFLWGDQASENAMDAVLEKIIRCTIAKQRNGPTGEMRFRFLKSFQRFYEDHQTAPSLDAMNGNFPSVSITQHSQDKPPF